MLLSLSLLTLAAGRCIAYPTNTAPAGTNVTTDPTTGLPIVDLGYELHRALNIDTTNNYYNFSNIRYAAPPVGNLRFRKPTLPETNRAEVQDGAQGRICPSVWPQWQTTAQSFMIRYATKNWDLILGKRSAAAAATENRESEDCLFLDVVVPKKVFDSKTAAPVLVWIYGGGFATGEKANYHGGSPSGIIKKSNDSVVFVSMNYRGGAFGFLGGSEFQKNGDANAGLWDQKMALQWVQDHIADFGGDSKKVTVIGESAGGASIMHHITAFGGSDKPLFAQAIPQSPGFLPQSNKQSNSAFADFLTLAGVKTLDEARLLPADKLMAVNQQQINNAPYGTFVYGPTIDGGLVPRLPAEILKDPGFSTDVHLMLGHNSNEGLVFVNPNADGTDTADTYIPNLQASLPAIKPEDMVYLNNTLYQVSTYGTGPGQFKDEVRRQAQTAADAGIICNTYALTTSSKSVYLYEYSVNPGYHGEDLEDTFWTKARANIPAGALQDWIASFTLSGVPSSSSGPTFPEYGAGQNILNLKSGKAPIAAVDDIPVERCKQWIDKIFPNVR